MLAISEHLKLNDTLESGPRQNSRETINQPIPRNCIERVTKDNFHNRLCIIRPDSLHQFINYSIEILLILLNWRYYFFNYVLPF
jgi:hypothetical protein